MTLVIVESPGKVKNIQKYLGSNYHVESTQGHIRDLALTGRGHFGVDIEHDFTPTYVIAHPREQLVSRLKRMMKECDEVILATDPDREGEAIAWHVAQVLGLDINITKRVEFNEITKDTVTREINNPRLIDLDLVKSQEARRILDRIIGFELSTWVRKIAHSESAGRVQSPVLKLVCDLDQKIDAFIPETYYVISVDGVIKERYCHLTYDSYQKKKDKITDEEVAKKIIVSLGDSLTVTEVKYAKKAKSQILPFETSTLQSEASGRLGCSTSQVAALAQSLYNEGYITYMRTDSTRLSPVFVGSVFNYIKENYGEEYVGHLYQAKKKDLVQDAHEAIRPTSIVVTPEEVRTKLKDQEYRLYELIYNRTLASLMKPKVEEILTISFEVEDSLLHYDFIRTFFDGYSVLNHKENNYSPLPEIKEGDVLIINEKGYESKTSEPPSHYSEGKLTDMMKKEGIGRPSTYATTINTLKERNYVNFINGRLIATEKGKDTCYILTKYFPLYTNTKFTAKMEEDLDSIGSKEKSATEVLKESTDIFYETLKKANETAEKLPQKETGETCPLCGSPLVIKMNKRNRNTFLGCSSYPQCNYIKNENPADFTSNSGNQLLCPRCHLGHLTKKKGVYGTFYSCNRPECNYTRGSRYARPRYQKK